MASGALSLLPYESSHVRPVKQPPCTAEQSVSLYKTSFYSLIRLRIRSRLQPKISSAPENDMRLLFIFLVCLFPGLAVAQSEQPLRLVVPFAAGGTSDIVARSLQAALEPPLGRRVLVDNKPGATGTIAARIVATSPPDGNTLMVPNTGNTLAPLLQEGQQFDYKTSLAPVAMVAKAPMAMVVSASMPVNNTAEFIAYTKANPEKVNFGISGIGSLSHLAGELLQQKAGIKFHLVPYQSGSQVTLAVAADEIQMMILTVPDVKAALNINKALKVLAVTSPERSALLPDVPAMAEVLPGYAVEVNFGLLAPAGTPEPVKNKLAESVRTVLSDEAVRQKFFSVGVQAAPSSSEQYGKIIKADYDLWEPIIRSFGLKK